MERVCLFSYLADSYCIGIFVCLGLGKDLFVFVLALRHGMQDLSSPDQRLNPCPPAVEVRSLNHWTSREVLLCGY